MPSGSNKSGSVLVVGAGIAGMQSALDLANSGFRVYLVEEGASIGGVMPKLDKTFPTNDCAMCILAPRLVDTGRHPNIEIMCNSEVQSIEGEAGNFSVVVKTLLNCVDPEKCNGCGDCVEHCPVTVPSEFDEKIGLCHAIDRPFPQAIPNVFGIEKEGLAPCRKGCPAEANVQGYIALAANEKWAESFNLIRERIPFPGTLGRICHHPCELECNRKDIEEPVAIRDIKRFVADYIYDYPELEKERKEKNAERKRKNEEEGAAYIDPFEKDKSRGKDFSVAIIGAGPAGLTAAIDLSCLGYKVDIFEEEKAAGGMMRFVIPDFRLNKDYLDKEIQIVIKEYNLEIQYGKKYGRDFTISDLRKKGYEAVFLAIGAQKSRGMNIDNEPENGVYPGLDYIKDINKGELKQDQINGKNVVVVGGGDVAIDAARMSLRLGANVKIVYRRSMKEMPAREEEIHLAMEEGLEFMVLCNPKSYVNSSGKLKSVTCLKMRLGEPDESGRRRPLPIEGSEFDIPCDIAVMAIGQNIDTSNLEEDGIELEWNLIKSDPVTFQTGGKDVFAGGDVVSGPASVVDALRAGHETAVSIDRFLHGEDLRDGRPDNPVLSKTPERERYSKEAREEQETVSPRDRINNFNEVEKTLTKEQVIKEAKRCLDCGLCSECMECVLSCGRGAIDHELPEKIIDIKVGAVILSPGYERFLPETGESLGYDLYPNVLTSIQFERMLSASGPMNGHALRPSDNKAPKKIAWLQCVGSRDQSCDKPWCSSVCCMYATKEAVIAKEHEPGLETHIYYMDIRSFGKNFERYIDRAKDEYGVVFRQSKIPRVEQDPVTKNLIIRYIGDFGEIIEEWYDMVVLSVGMQPCAKEGSLAELFKVQLNEYGFIETSPYSGTMTSRYGIYAAGAVSEPKDIPEAVTDASSAAADAASVISSSRGKEIYKKKYPDELSALNEEPRIGLFVCHCGTNIGSVVDVPGIVEDAREWPDVVYVNDNLYTCSQDAQEIIKDKIKEHRLNRVVVASCTPRTHEELFKDTVREAGLNPFLFQMANIRDQCSWVHRKNPEKATIKAKQLVRMAIAKAINLFPVYCREVSLVQSALVIGAGISGMSAALSIANQGFDVYIVEKEKDAGGRLKEIYFGFQDENPGTLLRETVDLIMAHERIKVFLDSEIENLSGYIGNFISTVKTPDSVKEINHGVIIVATGADACETDEYLYTKNKDVILQKDFEKILYDEKIPDDPWKEVVMIQCVGSRSDEHPWCSRVCCSTAIRNAIKVKEKSPATQVYILYRDIRTYGFKEDYLYRKARDMGVLFIRFEKDKKPLVKEVEGLLEVTVTDDVLNRNIVLHPGCLVLSTGIVPGENEKIAKLLKVPLNEDGFFVEAHAKLRPIDFANDGIYLCGTAHSPRFIGESIIQAKAAAARAATVLSKEKLETKGIIVQVNPRKCVGCEVCVSVCSYEARKYDPEKGYVTVNEILCQGCGACSAACPNGATEQNKFTSKQIFAMIDTLSV
jgi:heterodisulfide reductase subunit A2